MDRRQFLTGAGCITGTGALQGPINKVFLPIIQAVDGARFAVIADTQMFQGEIDEIFPQIAARPVEFVVHAGDVIGTDPIRVNGADPFLQWPQTVANLTTLGKPWYAVAGNHDWGTAYARPGTFDDYRQDALTAWAQFVGDKQWVKEIDHTRVVGLDYHNWTVANQDWIAAQLDTTKRKVVVSHYPLVGVSMKWQDIYWDWWDWWETEKIAFFQAHDVDVFVCGHRHQFGLSQVGSMVHIICPPICPVVGNNQPEPAEGGIVPVTIPTRGWLEFEDRPETLLCELYRNDGKLLAAWAL